ncbi:putative Ninja family, Jas TPL-binding domain-containing protein [Helianthus anomalus]
MFLTGTNRETSETNNRSELNKVKCNPKSKDHKHRAYDERMPCVSTKGDGPDGKRIQGLLYRYGKGEEVRIVCVCHGNFLTPAEFVKHGGGGDVEHPLRHIVVTSLFS